MRAGERGGKREKEGERGSRAEGGGGVGRSGGGGRERERERERESVCQVRCMRSESKIAQCTHASAHTCAGYGVYASLCTKPDV